MKISVIIPTWNRVERLKMTLASVYRQSIAPHEVIVVDDGSTDDTRNMMQQRFDAARYIHQENRGVSSARNTGIRAATGDWIALLDSDDHWQPNKLERQRDMLRTNSGYQLCHSDEIWIRNGTRVNPKKKHAKHGGLIFRQCLPLCVISPSASLIHRELFERAGLFDETLPACEDYDLWLRICADHPVLYVDEPLIVKYGGHPDQLSRRYWGMDRFRIHALEKILGTGRLAADDYAAALAMLQKKLAIVSQGAEKRGNLTLAQTCREKLRHYARAPRQTTAIPARMNQSLSTGAAS